MKHNDPHVLRAVLERYNRPLLVLGLTLVLVACRGGRPAPPAPDQRAPDRAKPARPKAVKSAPPDAGRPGPLVLRGLSVKGFQRAELEERSDQEEAHWGKVSTRTWSVRGKGQRWKRVVEIRLGRRSPRSIAGYLRHWRASHGCVAKKVRNLPPTRRGPVVPPQLTFEGVCKGGDSYIKRVLLLRDTAYELHADSFRGPAGLRARFLELLSAVELAATDRGATGPSK